MGGKGGSPQDAWSAGERGQNGYICDFRAASTRTNCANEYRKGSFNALCETRCIWRKRMVKALRSALLKEMMDEPKYDERESMMFMDVVLNASESRRCSDGRMRRGRRRDAATERGRREAHIVGAGET